MRTSENIVKIEGYLQEVDLEEASFNGKDCIRGTITIAVDQEYDNRQEHEEIPISVFSSKMTNAGKPNPAYKSIKEVEKWRRISTDGELAYKVRITSGEITQNAFIPQGSTSPISTWRVRGSFFSRVSGEFDPCAVFKNEIYIRKIEEEIRDDEPTGRLIVQGILVGYGDRADVVTYYVENEKYINHIKNNWQEDMNVNVGGYIRYCASTVNTTADDGDGFGEQIAISRNRTVRELVITQGSFTGKDEDEAFDSDEIRAAMNARKIRIEASGKPTAKKPTKPTRGW